MFLHKLVLNTTVPLYCHAQKLTTVLLLVSVTALILPVRVLPSSIQHWSLVWSSLSEAILSEQNIGFQKSKTTTFSGLVDWTHCSLHVTNMKQWYRSYQCQCGPFQRESVSVCESLSVIAGLQSWSKVHSAGGPLFQPVHPLQHYVFRLQNSVYLSSFCIILTVNIHTVQYSESSTARLQPGLLIGVGFAK